MYFFADRKTAVLSRKVLVIKEGNYESENPYIDLRACVFKETEDGEEPYEAYIVRHLAQRTYQLLVTKDNGLIVIDIT